MYPATGCVRNNQSNTHANTRTVPPFVNKRVNVVNTSITCSAKEQRRRRRRAQSGKGEEGGKRALCIWRSNLKYPNCCAHAA